MSVCRREGAHICGTSVSVYMIVAWGSRRILGFMDADTKA